MTVRKCLGRSAAVILGILATAACATASPEAASSAVPAASAFLAQLRPHDLGREFEAVQLVTVSRDDKVFVAEVRLSVKADRLILVAQDTLGQRLMTIVWTDAGITDERSPNLPAVVSPKGMLADLVAIGASEAAVRRALQQGGARLVAQDGQRIILSGDKETMRAVMGWPSAGPWTGRTSYRNVRAGYSVDIQSVEQL
jgi:Protein of unknown function (DUF3261)